jgi:hypothetical protein
VFIQPHAVPALPQNRPASPCEPRSALGVGPRLIRQEIVGIVDQRAWTKAELNEAKARPDRLTSNRIEAQSELNRIEWGKHEKGKEAHQIQEFIETTS